MCNENVNTTSGDGPELKETVCSTCIDKIQDWADDESWNQIEAMSHEEVVADLEKHGYTREQLVKLAGDCKKMVEDSIAKRNVIPMDEFYKEKARSDRNDLLNEYEKIADSDLFYDE